MRLTVNEDCGNAPRKRVLRDLKIAWTAGDGRAVADRISDDVRWKRVGEGVLEGKAELERAVSEMSGVQASRLVIDNIITHGATAAVNGRLDLERGRTYEFCDVYRFGGHGRNAKITEIASYVLEVPGD